MKIARFILAILYLLQGVGTGVTCYFAVKLSTTPLSLDPNDDSFGAGIAAGLSEMLQPFIVATEGAFFLSFFVVSLLTSIFLFREKNLMTALAFAAAGILAPAISALLCWWRGDLAWTLFASAEVLLGVATITVLITSLRKQHRTVLRVRAVNA